MGRGRSHLFYFLGFCSRGWPLGGWGDGAHPHATTTLGTAKPFPPFPPFPGITDDHHGTNSTVLNWECARERDTTQPPALHDYLLGPANKSGAFFTEPVACEPARSGAADLALRRPKGRKGEPLVAAGVRPVRTIELSALATSFWVEGRGKIQAAG